MSDDGMRRDFKNAPEFRAAALAQLPDLAPLSRVRLTELLREYSDALRHSSSHLDRVWWLVQAGAVQAELERRPHGKPRTRASGR